MMDEGEDDDFFPPPPPCMSPSPPTADPGVKDSSATVTNGAVGVAEAKANPKGSERHHGEEQLTSAQDTVDGVTESERPVNGSEECVDTVSLSEEMDSTPSTEPDQTSVDDTSALTESNEGSERIVTLSEDSNRHRYQSAEEITGEETDCDTAQTEEEMRGRTESEGEDEDIHCLAEDADSTQTTETVDSNSVETNAATPPGVSVSGGDFIPTCGTDVAANQPEEPAEVSSYVDTTSLNFTVTKEQWVSRDSTTSEVPLPQLLLPHGSSIHPRTEPLPPADGREGGEDGPEEGGEDGPEEGGEDGQEEGGEDGQEGGEDGQEGGEDGPEEGGEDGPEEGGEDGPEEGGEDGPEEGGEDGPEEVRIGNEQDESSTIATDIQQGNQLLQRLQLLQQRHDVEQVSDRPPPSQQEVLETANQSTGYGEVEGGVFGMEEEDVGAEQGDQTNEEGMGDSRFNTNDEEEEKMEESEEEPSSSSTMSVQLSNHEVTTVEAENSDDQSDSGVSADSSTQETLSTQIPTSSTHRHASAAETSTEREIQQTVPGKQNSQRARGVFKLADDPEVPETNNSPYKLPNRSGPDQSTEWQFSEQKMQQEISQEIQRELVLVNQGKIPGGYSKGTVCHLKEKKMLFEAFQLDNTEAVTQRRKPPSSLFRGYPSVLERTRSLEMFSLNSCPMPRTHSLRLHKPTAPESPETGRTKSPVGGSRDNARSSPYSKQECVRLYRGMDSLNIDVPASNVENGSNTRERNKSHECLLKENPFFKLRPALALQPEVEKDIWEAKEREEELHRQRCTLYGETRRKSTDDRYSHTISSLTGPGPRQHSKGKLDLTWPPPPPNKDHMRCGQTQQESRVHKATSLWQRWENGLINGKK